MSVLALYLLLLRATVTSFSGFASVPVVRDDLVLHRGVLSDDQLNAALAISQASPGPLGMYVVIVGYFVTGLVGAAAGMCALATPAVLVIPILRAARHGRAETIRNASAAIVIASCILMAVSAIRLMPTATPNMTLGGLAVICFAALASGRVAPLYVVLGSGFAALLI